MSKMKNFLMIKGTLMRLLFIILFCCLSWQVLAAKHINYIPYADAYGVYNGRWSSTIPAIKKYWTPYLENTISMKDALINIKNTLLSQPYKKLKR